ncbi:MAG: metal ABC transporter substrate-binding protein [Chloroflexota bacterium]|nr:metal ABC transporter substrate-binding protein [Chloroflexota bacterium]
MPRLRALALSVALLASAGIAILGSLACGSDDADSERLQIVVSTQVIADWARQVGGDLVEVRALVPAGADAHTFEVTVDDIRAVADADLVVINGAGLESGYEEAVEENATNLLELANAVEALGHVLHPFEGLLGSDEEHHQGQGEQEQQQQQQQEHHQGQQEQAQQQEHHQQQQQEDQHGQQEEEHEHDHTGEDPHFWFDADIAMAAVAAIAAELIALAPDAEDDIIERRDSYLKEIEEADDEVRELLADIPANQRLLFTFHDAFGYFARRYDLTVAGFLVEGPEQGVSAETIIELVELIEHEGIRTIFHEPQFDSGILDAISEETGAAQGIIWSQPTDEKPTYIDILVGNAEAIANQ